MEELQCKTVFTIPVFGGIGTFLFGRHEKPVLIKTYLDRVIFENGLDIKIK